MKDFVVELGLEDIITFVLGGDDVPRAKPAPDPVLLTLAHCQAAAGEALVVGDTKYDILMGKNAGVTACGVTTASATCSILCWGDEDCYFMCSLNHCVIWRNRWCRVFPPEMPWLRFT